MSFKKLFALLAALLLKATGALAQDAPGPAAPGYQQVSVPVPRAVTLVTDVAQVLFSRTEAPDKVQALLDRRRERSKKGSQTLTFTIPSNRLTRTLGLVEE